MQIVENQEHIDNQLESIVSYMTLRKGIGILGMLLPFILFIGNSLWIQEWDVLGAMSSYYHTIMGDIFVGTICIIALFLYVYKGKDKDYIWLRIGAILAIVVAFFPTKPATTIQQTIDMATNCATNPACADIATDLEWSQFTSASSFPAHFSNEVVETLHFVSAIGFFVILGYVILFLFTKSGHSKSFLRQHKSRKYYRNRVYYFCGGLIYLALFIGLIYFLMYRNIDPKPQWILDLDPIFWIEAICLWAFGAAWLVKGQGILKDK